MSSPTPLGLDGAVWDVVELRWKVGKKEGRKEGGKEGKEGCRREEQHLVFILRVFHFSTEMPSLSAQQVFFLSRPT